MRVIRRHVGRSRAGFAEPWCPLVSEKSLVWTRAYNARQRALSPARAAPDLSVLERSRLVKSKKRGRVRTYEIAPERFEVVEDWLAERRQMWEARLTRFDQYVKQLKEKESKS